MKIFRPASLIPFTSHLDAARLRRAVTFAFLIGSLAVQIAAQTDREREGLQGPVQVVRTRTTTTVDENGVKTETPLFLSHEVKYERDGRRSEQVLYDKEGNFSRKTVYSYDANSKNRIGLTVFNSNSVAVRRVLDVPRKLGGEKTRTVEDFNDDGSLYKKSVQAFNQWGEMFEVTEFGADGAQIMKIGLPVAKHESETQSDGESGNRHNSNVSRIAVPFERESKNGEMDRVVSNSSRRGEYFDIDSHGNWTRGITSSGSTTYASGKKIQTTEVVYRELIYFPN